MILASIYIANWLYWTLNILYVLTILSIIGVIISENRNPVKSLAWITVLLVVPVVGLGLYILFGRSLKNKRFISKRNRRRLKRYEHATNFVASRSGLSAESIQQIKLGHSLVNSPCYSNNEATIMESGKEKFDVLLDDIRNAQKFIYIQYYIFNDDEIGKHVADALIEKAKAGVTVRIIYDHVGSFKTSRKFIKRMTNAGVEIYPFFKVTFPFLGSRINWRNHRKIVIIDGNIGYIGGMNIADRYVTGGRFKTWRDTHLRLKGPIIRSLNHSFATDWHFMGQPIPEDFSPDDCPPTDSNISMQLVTSVPARNWSNIAMVFLKAIGNAKKSIYLQTPYFLPTDALLRALEAAALSKIDVRIMIPRTTDSVLMHYASLSYIKECLQAGIKVYFYEEGMLHSKTLIVDDEFCSVGSTNFDFRSFEHNFESNLFLYSKEFNSRLTARFMEDLSNSTLVQPQNWAKRPVSSKIAESLMRLFAPIL